MALPGLTTCWTDTRPWSHSIQNYSVSSTTEWEASVLPVQNSTFMAYPITATGVSGDPFLPTAATSTPADLSVYWPNTTIQYTTKSSRPSSSTIVLVTIAASINPTAGSSSLGDFSAQTDDESSTSSSVFLVTVTSPTNLITASSTGYQVVMTTATTTTDITTTVTTTVDESLAEPTGATMTIATTTAIDNSTAMPTASFLNATSLVDTTSTGTGGNGIEPAQITTIGQAPAGPTHKADGSKAFASSAVMLGLAILAGAILV